MKPRFPPYAFPVSCQLANKHSDHLCWHRPADHPSSSPLSLKPRPCVLYRHYLTRATFPLQVRRLRFTQKKVSISPHSWEAESCTPASSETASPGPPGAQRPEEAPERDLQTGHPPGAAGEGLTKAFSLPPSSCPTPTELSRDLLQALPGGQGP